MHLIRLQLPDRPGSLGTVASALGTVNADISAMEIVEKGDGWVVDDFMLSVPEGGWVDDLVSACNQLEGVRVLWVSRYPDSWGLEGDVALLERMLLIPEHAAEVLVEGAPRVFHCQWAALVATDGRGQLHGSEQAPELQPEQIAALGDLTELDTRMLEAGWLPMWGDTELAVCPVDERRSIVLGRHGGPDFLTTELHRLQHLAALAAGAREPKDA